MEEYINGLNNWTVVKYLGGIYVIITAVLTYIGSLLNKIIVNRIQRDSDSKFEELKGEISRINSLESNFTQQYGQVFHKLLETRIPKIEKYWDCILEIKSSIPDPVLLSYQILIDSELNTETLNRSSIGTKLSKLHALEDLKNLISQKKEIEKLRPFISEKLWLLGNVYSDFIGRCSYLLIDGYKKGKIVIWKYDTGVKQILLTSLSEKEIGHILKNEFHTFENFLQLLEYKMLNEVSRLISNEALTEDGFRGIELFNRLLNANPKGF
ncbi:hypothetical protein [Lacihabitans soyangensis]|uniref:Uncharacterized protein n=1 Tax=Lacihabitans soyangensis TaxID=869394 RepID=A0AAE3H167_9BACT|nr:hypothetical protein [Lacihabitans soyangensis]MCP9762395.1 hypothetical protein [Lacihabitans soyangensis]